MQLAQDLKQPLPVARTRNLVVKELSDETLIYDLDSDEAHCLNQTAALIWKNCDGNTSVSGLRGLIEKEIDLAVPEEVVWLALDQLEKSRLIEDVPPKPQVLVGMRRRQLIKTLGIATIALPMIISIVSPTALAQGSKVAPGGCCNGNGNCQSGNCATVPVNPCPGNRTCVP